MDEPIEVEAGLLPNGDVQPRAFRWEGRLHQIAAVGRQWTEQGEHRFLVMTPDERVFELALLPDAAGWRLRRTPAAFGGRGNFV
jgi:hypothetical protein